MSILSRMSQGEVVETIGTMTESFLAKQREDLRERNGVLYTIKNTISFAEALDMKTDLKKQLGDQASSIVALWEGREKAMRDASGNDPIRLDRCRMIVGHDFDTSTHVRTTHPDRIFFV